MRKLPKSKRRQIISATLAPPVVLMLEAIARSRHSSRSYAIEEAVRHEFKRMRRRRELPDAILAPLRANRILEEV